MYAYTHTFKDIGCITSQYSKEAWDESGRKFKELEGYDGI